jgi:hypothetical protein
MKKLTLFLLILMVVTITSCKTTQSATEYNDPKPSVTDTVPNYDFIEENTIITNETTEEEIIVEEIEEEIEEKIEVEEKKAPVKTVKEPEEDGAYKNIEVIRYKID